MTIPHTLYRELRDCVMILFGTALYSLGCTLFFMPYHLTSGGLTGVALIIFYATGIETQVSYAALNTFLLIGGLIILGWRFCLKTIVGVIGCTVFLWMFQRIFEDSAGVLPTVVGDERFMAVFLGSIMEGFALSICFANRGSTGGTDIIAAVVNKYKDVSLGQIIMLCDLIVVSSCYFIFDDIQMVVFGYVIMAIVAVTLDYLTRWMHQAVEFKIFSRNHEAIADALIDEGFGLTAIDGTGWYTKTERKVLVCVATKRHSNTIARIVKSVDPFAFLSVTHVEGVYGEGFDTLKVKVKNQKPIVVFASNNAHKLDEVRAIIGDRYEVRSLKEIGCTAELPETHHNLKDNALEKAQYVKQFYGFDCIADDTGLEVTALDGRPGVYSARYATISEEGWQATGQDHDSALNIKKLLFALDGKEDRSAQFRTVIAYVTDDATHFFEGIVTGNIALEPRGTDGFGYDPVFRPHGYSQTFAEMPAEEKNKISHRGRAVEKFVEFLNK